MHTSHDNAIATTVNSFAAMTDDLDMLENIENIMQSNIILKYHMKCINDYKSECSRRAQKVETSVSCHRKCYKLAYDSISTFVQNIIVVKRECCYLSRLRRMFIEQLENELAKGNLDVTPSYLAPCYLQKKLLETFKGQIKIISVKNCKLVIPYSGVNLEDLDLESMLNVDVIESAALLLRKRILQIEKNKLSSNLKTKNIVDGGHSEIP